MRTTVMLLLATVVLVAACSSGGAGASPSPSPSPSPTPTPPAGSPGASVPGASDLDGRTFIATRADGRVLVDGAEVRIGFEGGNLSASAGCNSMGGSFRIDDGRLRTANMFSTEMACDAPRMEQESWFSSFLGDAAISLDGNTLVLTGADGVVLTLVDREVVNPDRPLEGTRWIVTSLIDGTSGTVSSVPQGVTASLVFRNGSVEVETGCNRGGGSYTVADGVITFGNLTLTRIACTEQNGAVEGFVTSVIQGKVGFAIDADGLQLGGGNGPGLGLTAEG